MALPSSTPLYGMSLLARIVAAGNRLHVIRHATMIVNKCLPDVNAAKQEIRNFLKDMKVRGTIEEYALHDRDTHLVVAFCTNDSWQAVEISTKTDGADWKADGF